MDKVALVTGADRGLGYGLVQSLLESGWHVVAGKYLDWPDLDALTERFPTELLVVPLDVSSDASVREAARIAGDRFGHLDVLISSAGILLPGNELGIRQSPPFDEIMSEFNVNALGGLRVVEAFLPMLDRGAWKRLCFVSSEAGSIAASKRTAWFGYCMSKAALNMAVKNLSNDLAPQGYSLRLYHPGWMRTYMRGAKDLQAHLEPNQAATLALEYFLTPPTSDALAIHCWDNTEMPW